MKHYLKRTQTLKIASMLLVLIFCFAILSGCAGNLFGGNFSSLLPPMQKSAIRLTYEMDSSAELPIGASKIGGNPDLPPEFEWFCYEGESYEGITENRPLSFLAQINCAEVREYDTDSLLPESGMLYFFYELATMTWGFDPMDKGSARVYYYPGEVSALSRTECPSDLLDEYKIPEMAIAFSTEDDLPDFEEFIEWHDGFNYDQWDAYDRAKYRLLSNPVESYGSHLLGYADLIQGGMLLECERPPMAFTPEPRRAMPMLQISNERMQKMAASVAAGLH